MKFSRAFSLPFIASLAMSLAACGENPLGMSKAAEVPAFSLKENGRNGDAYVLVENDGKLENGWDVVFSETASATRTCHMKYSDPSPWKAVEGWLITRRAEYIDGEWKLVGSKRDIVSRVFGLHDDELRTSDLFGDGLRVQHKNHTGEFSIFIEVFVKHSETGEGRWIGHRTLCGY